MSNQTRYWNYGQVYDNLDFTTAQYTTHVGGPYRGLTLSANAFGNLEIAAGSGVLHDGFVWAEDDVNTLTFTPQALAADWTIVAVHENRQILGGVPVTYEMRAGYFATAADGVVLGWIRYPGGGIALLTAHCQSAPSQLASTYAATMALRFPESRLPPYNDHGGCFTQTIGPNCTISDLLFDVGNFVVYQACAKAPAGPAPPEQVIQHLQVYSYVRPTSVTVYCDVPAGPATNLTLGVYDVLQAPVALTGGVISNTVGWEQHTATVDLLTGTFTAGLPWTVRLTHNLDLGITIRLARVVVEYWPYP